MKLIQILYFAAAIKLFFACTLLLPVGAVLAQTFQPVSGKVFDQETGSPLTDVSIVVMNTQYGASTGPDGTFELRLQTGEYTLIISRIGYANKEVEVRVTDRAIDDLRIGLVAEEQELDHLTIWGRYYIVDRERTINSESVSILPAITTVSAIDIEKQGAVTLTDAFRYVPGGWLETRGRKTKQFFSIRGQRYPYPDYSINGVWQREFEETSYFLSALDIEQIEIVRSSNALVKGMSGLTGVIDVTTSMPEQESLSLSGKYGELGSYMTNFRYGNKISSVSWQTSASFFGTNGPDGRDGEERIANFYGNMDWEITPLLSLKSGLTYIYGSREFVRMIEPGSPNIFNRRESFDPIRTYLSYAKLDYRGSDDSQTELQVNFSHRNADYSSYHVVNQQTTTHLEKDYEYGFNLLHRRALTTSNTLRAGLLYNHWVAPEGKRFYAGRRADRHTLSGVIASEQRAGRYVFDAGIRLTSGYIVEWGGFGIEGSAAGFRDVAPIENQLDPLEWQATLGSSRVVTNSMSVHYNIAGGTVAPRSGSLNDEGERPDYELRLQHEPGFRYRSVQGNEWTINIFHTQRFNAIDFSGQIMISDEGYELEMYQNVDKRSYGLEISTNLQLPVLKSQLFANTILMRGELEENGSMVKDDKLPDVILNFGYQFEYAGLDANLFVHHTGTYKNNRFVHPQWIAENGDYQLGDFYSVDLTAGYTIHRRAQVRFFAEARNILDQKYETVAAYPDPGRILSSGFSLHF